MTDRANSTITDAANTHPHGSGTADDGKTFGHAGDCVPELDDDFAALTSVTAGSVSE